MKSLGFLCLVVVAGCQNKRDESSQGAALAAPTPTTNSGSAGSATATGSAPAFAPTPGSFEPATTRADAPYKADVQKVCDVIELSGAKDHESHDRTFLTATWLGKNLETPDARKWLASLQRFKGNAKADALDQEARRVGLATCALANEWRKPLPAQ